ncbi:MAG: hypothetical protein ABIO81_13380 [Ginsengibacter sp.]
MKSNPGVKNTITDSMQMIADMSMATVKSSLENISGNMGQLNKVMSNIGLGTFKMPFTQKSKHDCCAPEEECPPHCILQLTRHAYAGERIMVPFMIKNSCNTTRTYKIGVREMKNLDGSIAPAQPELNKKQVTLDADASEMVLLGIDLNQFSNGNTYTAEIVIREKDINQNICFTLIVDGNKNVPVAEPLDEKEYLLHWQSWKSHFYCEPKKAGRVAGAGINEG